SSRSPPRRLSCTRTRRSSVSSWWTSAAARPMSHSSVTARSGTRPSCRSAATTSRTTSPSASARRWPTPRTSRSGTDPQVIPAPHIRKILPRIDLHLHDLRRYLALVDEVVALEPDLDREPDVLRRAVGVADPQVHGHWQRTRAREEHGRGAAGRVGAGAHRVHGLVHHVRAVEPAPPEPGQVLAQPVFHGSEEIRRCGVLVRPAPDVLAECGV